MKEGIFAHLQCYLIKIISGNLECIAMWNNITNSFEYEGLFFELNEVEVLDLA
jgi:hypothetical protein